MALHVNNLIGFGAGGAALAMPSFIAASTGTQNTASDTLAINYPAGILANDIILCAVVGRDSNGVSNGDTVITGITNFSHLATGQHSAGKSTLVVYYKRATGSESGTETATMSSLLGTKSLTGIMFLFRYCITSGTPAENAAAAPQSSSSTWSQLSLTTLGASRLAAHIIGATVSATAGNFTGESNGDFTEAAIYSGTNATIQLQTSAAPNPVTISGGSVTASAAGIYYNCRMGLLPVPA